MGNGSNGNGRLASSTGQAIGQNLGFLAPLAVIVGWRMQVRFPDLPEAVSHAFTALIVGGGAVLFNFARHILHNRRQARLTTGSLVLAVALAVGCVHWDGASYRQLASDEVVLISITAPDQPLDAKRCQALARGAAALRDTTGASSSVNGPFSSGQHVAAFAKIHAQQAAVCEELVSRDAQGFVTPGQRERTRKAWGKTWVEGRQLLGGGGPR